ncbi:diadenosine tetraphosphate (Ap4A) HIT family hydrolase [Lachnotalea glycerini]|uniref:Diadenosine tetraphosphate (Ap4A) HIT family hydrolase n=1 Tax=Lachnotalea glycerini TaxID=1763509 RepID=A0A255I6U6_9FIRM|nr:HIT family protein [Lachnotalea glycerini]PXV95551.1 diadenosine tetraphosphate (Ap4A) HIT family hydrolase [Lachnotalea glycerini]RDY32867.1 HIT family protein [Lachnotalea glycerini]
MECFACKRIKMIKEKTNPYFVKELETGYVVIGDYQHFKGYTVFICKEHVAELHQLPYQFRIKYLEEMSVVAEAVFRAFRAEKLNCELLGNCDNTHSHWHIFPRFSDDMPKKGPVWLLPREEMYHMSQKPSEEELKSMVSKLKNELNELIIDSVMNEKNINIIE